MRATGIGFAGLDGAWWLPAAVPFSLPAVARDELTAAGRAIFALLDALADLYATAPEVRTLLDDRVPAAIPRLTSDAPVLMVRPDFQLVEDGDTYRFVASEIEIAPAAQGFAHAMQVGYRLETDLADWFATFLDGRPLLFVGTHQWSEFLFEQLAFCRALAERGATGYVVYDRPLAAIAAEVAEGRRWVPPMFGVSERPAGWTTDVLGRIVAASLDRFVWRGGWSEEMADAVVFRFGYFDSFAPATVAAFARWQAAGATFLNPPTYYLESKAVLAAARLPAVRQRLAACDPAAPPALDRCLPETVVLSPDSVVDCEREREGWVLKYAGFDGGNQAWGGRSVQFGREHTADTWRVALAEALSLDWPVVAQRLVPSSPVDIDYLMADGSTGRLAGGTPRLRVFLLRDHDNQVRAAGTHLTVSARAQVSEATDAVQAPVLFARSWNP